MITDLSYLKSMSNDDPVFIKEMIDIFKEQVIEYATNLKAFNADGDYDKLSKLAHKAKSSVAVMGMTKEAELLKDIEIKAKKEEDTASFSAIIDTIVENSRNAVIELDTLYK